MQTSLGFEMADGDGMVIEQGHVRNRISECGASHWHVGRVPHNEHDDPGILAGQPSRLPAELWCRRPACTSRDPSGSECIR